MKQRVIDKFVDIYGGSEQGVKVYFAPGRVNLIGEHTDYNGGHVFPCAITIGTYAAARKRQDSMFRFYSLNYPEQGVLELPMEELGYRQEDGWANYPKGVIDTFRKKNYPVRRGLDLFYYGEIPKGLGLGSSASLEVVTGLILRDMMGYEDVSMVDLSLFAQLAENEYMGNRCGIMDPFTSAMGRTKHALLLDTSDLSYVYVPLKLSHERIIITNSKKERAVVEAEYEKRRKECETALMELQQGISIRSLGELTAEVLEEVQEMIKDPVRVRRARHAVTENQRTIQAAEALEKGDIHEFGQLMNASHLSLKEDYEVSCPELDILVEEAWDIDGVLGSRMMGAGFGGCTVSIVDEDAVNEFITRVGKNYQERTGLTPEFYVVVTGNGACVL